MEIKRPEDRKEEAWLMKQDRETTPGEAGRSRLACEGHRIGTKPLNFKPNQIVTRRESASFFDALDAT